METPSKKLYRVWHSMKQRCLNKNNPNYNDYGGRGITVSDSWLKYKNFEDDMYESYVDKIFDYSKNYFDTKNNKKNVSLDRVNNNGNYCKENCRWATAKEQNNNRRLNSRSKLIKIGNKEKTLIQWCYIFNIKRGTVEWRMKNMKWKIIKALKTPLLRHQRSISIVNT